MPSGYFEFMITVRNTGQVATNAYVGMSVYGETQWHPGFWAKKKVFLQPGGSSTVRLTTGMRDWAGGAHSYLVRFYSKALSEGNYYADYGDWTIYEYGTGAPDDGAILAERSGTVYV